MCCDLKCMVFNCLHGPIRGSRCTCYKVHFGETCTQKTLNTDLLKKINTTLALGLREYFE